MEITNTRSIDNQQLINGDCLEIIKSFKDKFIDQVITSPPYNIGIKYNTYKDNLSNDDYLRFIKNVFIEIKRVLKDDGSIFLNIGGTNSNPWIPYDIINTIRDLFILQNNIIWVKSICIDENNIYGHYKPVNSDRYIHNMFEHIFHLTKTGKVKIQRKEIGVPYKYKVNLQGKTITEDIRCRGNTWFIPYETIHSKIQRGNHPAIFPEKLVEFCIKLHGFNKDTIICDPFLGSATTLLVSKKLKCMGIGIEIDKKYFNYSYDRLVKSV